MDPVYLRILYVVYSVICAVLSAVVATTKDRNPATWFLGGLFFGVLGLIAAAGADRPHEDTASHSHKTCPYCQERIRTSATACRYCGREVAERDMEPDTTP